MPNPYLGRADPPWSEFEVQAVAYAQLVKWLGPLRVRGEYSMPLDLTYEGKRGTVWRRKAVRFDIVVLDEDGRGRLLVLEVKRRRQNTRQGRRQSTQYPQAAGCPCIFINGMQDAVRIMAIVAEKLQGSVPAPVEMSSKVPRCSG